jgi:hypothetical protein
MKDIRDEIERLTALLSFRVEHLAKRENRPIHFSSYAVAVRPGRLVQLFSTLLHLPRGYAATFMPRSQPEADGTWRIDIRRNDGVTRESWFDGIVVGSDGNELTLLYKGRALQMEDLERIVSDLTKPGLSGMALDINRLYRMFFGRMEQPVMEHLDAIRDVDLLDDVYTALISGKSQRVVDGLIRQTVETTPLASSASPPPVVESELLSRSDSDRGSGRGTACGPTARTERRTQERRVVGSLSSAHRGATSWMGITG